MKISLITVTMGDRADALIRLKNSLARQTFRDFEHIVVDQREHPELRGGLSRARNFGMRQAKGDVIAFPDDDAWYGPTVLQDVADILSDVNVDGVSFRVVDDNGNCSAGGWMATGKKYINKRTVWHTAVSCSFFLKRDAIGKLRFDERLGVGSGTRFGSGEETDFLLSILAKGARILYDGTKCVFHPSAAGKFDVRKGWLYGNGMGTVLRRHHYPIARIVWVVAVQIARVLQSLVQFRFNKAVYHLAMASGRLWGFVRPLDMG
mgnify:FL=1